MPIKKAVVHLEEDMVSYAFTVFIFDVWDTKCLKVISVYEIQ